MGGHDRLSVVAGHGVHGFHYVKRGSVPEILNQICAGQSVSIRGIYRRERSCHAIRSDILRLLCVVLNQICGDHTRFLLRHAGRRRISRISYSVTAASLPNAHEVSGCKDLATGGTHGMHRIAGRPSYASSRVAEREWSHDRLTHSSSVFPGKCVDWVRGTSCVSISSVITLHQERCPAFDGELIHATDDAAHCVPGQRPYSGHAVFLFYFSLACEHRIAWNGPVDNLCGASPWKQFPALDFFAVPWCMGSLRPYNGPSIAPRNEYEPLPRCGGPIIRGDKLSVLNIVPEGLKLALPLQKGLARQLLDRAAFSHWPPCHKFLDVLKDDDPGSDDPGPSQHDPRKTPNVPVNQGRSLRLGEMLAVW